MSARRKPVPTPDPEPTPPNLSAYPVREYLSAMSQELASMAHEDGDTLLAKVLEAASELARRPA